MGGWWLCPIVCASFRKTTSEIFLNDPKGNLGEDWKRLQGEHWFSKSPVVGIWTGGQRPRYIFSTVKGTVLLLSTVRKCTCSVSAVGKGTSSRQSLHNPGQLGCWQQVFAFWSLQEVTAGCGWLVFQTWNRRHHGRVKGRGKEKGCYRAHSSCLDIGLLPYRCVAASTFLPLASDGANLEVRNIPGVGAGGYEHYSPQRERESSYQVIYSTSLTSRKWKEGI